MSTFLDFFVKLAEQRKSDPTDLDREIYRLNQEHDTDVLGFISQKPPQAQAPMIDSANLIKETNSMAGVSNPALAMLQSSAQAAPIAPALTTYNPTSNDLPILTETEDSDELKTIKKRYDEVADKQAFLQDRQRQPFNFFG